MSNNAAHCWWFNKNRVRTWPEAAMPALGWQFSAAPGWDILALRGRSDGQDFEKSPKAIRGRTWIASAKVGASKAAGSHKANLAEKTNSAGRKPTKKQRSGPSSAASLRAQMTAASRVLELIAKSPSDLQPVFKAIAESARELTGAMYCSVARLEDGLVKIAQGNDSPERNTRDMFFNCRKLISYASRIMSIKAGDIMFRGTPQGVILGEKAPREERQWLKARTR